MQSKTSKNQASLYQGLSFKGSTSFTKATEYLEAGQFIKSGELVAVMLDYANYGKKYAAGRLADFDHTKVPGAAKSFRGWLEDFEWLFAWEVVATNYKEAILDGRMAIFGLGLLDHQIRDELERLRAWKGLVEEMKTPFEILSAEGEKKYYEYQTDRVPVLDDNPVEFAKDDLLGRQAFASFLAERLNATDLRDGSYAIHVYAPWGAGKSSLLNFLKWELEHKKALGEKEWIVVDFNAWQHQHIQPPWWSLMDQVFKRTSSALRWRDWFKEYYWRLTTGRAAYILVGLIILWAIILGIQWLVPEAEEKANLIKLLGQSADSFAKILGLIATIWGGIFALSRSLLFSSAEGAKKYTELTGDPMNKIKGRFNKLIKRVPKKVILFVDDLDRCQSQYVVELLEGVQTLLREAPVAIVVTADRHWLNACFEKEYENIQPFIRERGKSLGELFLEKAFRFSIPMPNISDEQKENFWLEQINAVATEEEPLQNSEGNVPWEEDMKNARSDQQVLEVINKYEHLSFREQMKVKKEAVTRLAASDMEKVFEHTLKPYYILLNPNPRSMKRLVNTYSANRAISILAGTKVDKHQLVLWTILSSQWPDFTEHLTKLNQQEETIQFDDLIKEKWGDIIANPSFQSLKEGGPYKSAPLLADTLRVCAEMQV